MSSEFEMSMIGELSFFLGLQITQKEDDIQIHQQKYLKELLKKFKMEACKSMVTPSTTSEKLKKCLSSPKVNKNVYRGMIGSLMYLTASKPDIVFAVCLCARFQSDPREPHLVVVKRIFCYLMGIDNLCLCHPKECPFELVGYTDSDLAGFL